MDASRILDITPVRAKDAEAQHLRAAKAMKEQQQAEQSATCRQLQTEVLPQRA